MNNSEQLYAIDEDLLRNLAPDVIITQDLCRVCAVSSDNVCDVGAKVISLDPHTISEVAQSVITLANALGVASRGEQVANGNRCASCHLPGYAGREQMPRLAGQREDYLLHSMRQFQNNQATGRDTIMAASLYGIADADVKAMAHYFAHLPP